jgi:hypothetical protein
VTEWPGENLAGEIEDGRGKGVAGVEIDEILGDVVDDRDGCRDRSDGGGGSQDQDEHMGNAQMMEQLGDEAIDGKRVDEPEDRIGLVNGADEQAGRAGRVAIDQEVLEADEDHRPERVEIEIMDNAAVGEMEPGAGDDRREEQARDEEEFGHAERGGEPQDVMHEADLAGGFAHAIG